MKNLTRRSFLLNSAVVAGIAATGAGVRPSTWAAPVGANGSVRLGIIGCGAKALAHIKQLLKRTDVRIVALCDVDPQQLAKAVEEVKGSGLAPFTSTDARAVLARDDVDAVLIVTPNHWHALLTVWACQAGKDVYVEKPMSHTVWEGRKMVEAAAKYGRVVQVGTQYRSEPGLAEGIKYLHAGGLGKLKHVHAIYYGKRDALPRKRAWYPDWLNYDVFCGPTPVLPLERDKLHYDWHWSWATGKGDHGNNGVHILVVARRIVRADGPPKRVLGVGGRFVHDDPAETPNAQLAVYDFPGAPVIYEQRGLPAKPGVNYMDQVGGLRVGVVAYCEGGTLSGLIGCTANDHAGKVIKKFPGDGGVVAHMTNFLDAVRSRRTGDLAAPTTVGHASASICHFGNISLRVGTAAGPVAVNAALEAVPAAAEIGRSMAQHLGVHGVDLEKRPLTLGPWVSVDAGGDGIAGLTSGGDAALERARYLLHETQRPPYVIPDVV
ncbi:MAG: Gfo/Idh/MocA family oxidoreductase [Verrucomicrobia bacterium]|nr:Gfo/Idh/MocA family oxidoreductase [Verrucomicrobiota bacterium]